MVIHRPDDHNVVEFLPDCELCHTVAFIVALSALTCQNTLVKPYAANNIWRSVCIPGIEVEMGFPPNLTAYPAPAALRPS